MINAFDTGSIDTGWVPCTEKLCQGLFDTTSSACLSSGRRGLRHGDGVTERAKWRATRDGDGVTERAKWRVRGMVCLHYEKGKLAWGKLAYLECGGRVMTWSSEKRKLAKRSRQSVTGSSTGEFDQLTIISARTTSVIQLKYVMHYVAMFSGMFPGCFAIISP